MKLFKVKQTNDPTVVAGASAGAFVRPPVGTLQCPVTRPFSKYETNKNVVGSCCKCQDQTQCVDAAAGTTWYNYGGVMAMTANNDVVDKSKFFYYLSRIHR